MFSAFVGIASYQGHVIKAIVGRTSIVRVFLEEYFRFIHSQ